MQKDRLEEAQVRDRVKERKARTRRLILHKQSMGIEPIDCFAVCFANAGRGCCFGKGFTEYHSD